MQVLSLIWALMMKFLKFSSGDEEDGASAGGSDAKTALLRWVQLNTIDYPNVKVESFKGSFNNGLAFCAVIHKVVICANNNLFHTNDLYQ